MKNMRNRTRTGKTHRIEYFSSLIFTFILFLHSNYIMSQNDKMSIDSVSYSLGVMIGQNLKDQGFSEINAQSFTEALETVFNGQAPAISVEKANQILTNEMGQRQMNLHKANKEAGESYLAQNAKRDEVTTLESGVQYEILEAGTGPKPKATDKVEVHYHGTLIDGKVFDSSVTRGESISFPVNGVIQGWQEILQLMPVGSKWKVYIPYDKAYGERGAGAEIKPFSALIFEIELLGIE
jgi:FKBP-type peptidyl-prolyl cis-trans isomerase FklB